MRTYLLWLLRNKIHLAVLNVLGRPSPALLDPVVITSAVSLRLVLHLLSEVAEFKSQNESNSS